MAARGLWLDNRSTAMDTAFGASEPFSGDYGSQGWYGQGAAPSGLSSRPYGLTQAAQGALAEPVPGNLSGSMGITSGYQGMLSAPLGHTTGLQQDSISTQRGPTPGYAGRSSALPYPERPGALSDFHRSGSEDRMGFSLPMGQIPDYNKGTSLPRGIASGDQDPFLPRQYTFDSQRPSSEIQGQLPASSRKSFEDFEYFEDYENPRELEYMGYEEPEELNKQDENEDLEGLGELMLDRYALSSKKDPPSIPGRFSPRSPPSSWSTSEYSRRHTRRSLSPLLFLPQNAFTERLDGQSTPPHFSSRYLFNQPRSRSRSSSEHSFVSKHKSAQQQPRGTRSKSPVSHAPRRQSPQSHAGGFRRSPLSFSSRSRKQSPPRQHYRDSGGSPQRYHFRGRSSRRSHARSRSPLLLAYQLKKQSPDSLDGQRHSRNRPCARMHSKGHSRSRHHSPSAARCTNSRSPQSKKNSLLRKTANSKTSSKTRSRSPETRAKKSRGYPSSRSCTSRNVSKSIKGRSSPMSPSKKLSATNGGKNRSPARLLSKDRSLQSGHTRIRSPPRANSNSLPRLSTSERRSSQNVSRLHEHQSSSSLPTEQTKRWEETAVNNARNVMSSEDLSPTGIKRSHSMSRDPWPSADHPDHVQSRVLSPSLKETRLWQSAESLDDPVEHAKSSSSPQQHFGVMIRRFPHHCSNKEISNSTYHRFETFGHVTSVEIHNSGENRFCLVFYTDPDEQKCALQESQGMEIFHQAVTVTAWDGPETESRVVLRPLSRGKAHQPDKKATKTLLIRNLDAKLAPGDIHHRFQAFGKILEINVKNKPDDGGCYADVQYSNINSVTRAIKEMDGVLFGDYKVNLSYGTTEPTECVWIDGLPGIAERTLIQLFYRHGTVSKVAIDNVNNKALVFFRRVSDAKRAINFMKGKKISGCPVMVDFANKECQKDFYDAMNVANKGRDVVFPGNSYVKLARAQLEKKKKRLMERGKDRRVLRW